MPKDEGTHCEVCACEFDWLLEPELAPLLVKDMIR